MNTKDGNLFFETIRTVKGTGEGNGKRAHATGGRRMLTRIVFVVVGCALMATTAWAQSLNLYEGELCKKKVEPWSGFLCGHANGAPGVPPGTATFVFQNVGSHPVQVGTTSEYWTTISCTLEPNETKQVTLEPGRAVYVTRDEVFLSKRTLAVLVKAITPCDTCAPMDFRDCIPVAPSAAPLAKGLKGAMGSTVGPDGALYVTEGAAGRISRVDPRTGEITTFASGLPKPDHGSRSLFGGVVDVAFLGTTAYALVTLDGHGDVSGIYRVDGPDRVTVVADIGEFSVDNPPTSLEFIGNTAYVVTLAGELWTIEGISNPPTGGSH